MINEEIIDERSLALIAKKFRLASGRNKSEAAKELKVSRPSIFYAEEVPEKSLFHLRKRIIEKYSPFTVVGPEYRLKRK